MEMMELRIFKKNLPPPSQNPSDNDQTGPQRFIIRKALVIEIQKIPRHTEN